MALSRTAMCRDSAPCSHSANGQTADRHPVCPSAVWPFFVPVRAVEGKTPVRAVGLARFCARVYNKKQKMPSNE